MFSQKLQDIICSFQFYGHLSVTFLNFFFTDPGRTVICHSSSFNTDEEKAAKEVELERCLKLACEVPFKIVELCNESIKLHEELVDKGSKLAISDVGCGVQALRGAILSAQLNVIINVGLMKDKEYAKALDEKCEALVKEGVEICDEVYDKVIAAMR